MAVPLLDLKAQHATIRDSVMNAMMKVIDEQAFILGEPVERLEREVALLSHTTHAIGCANGTDAILLALRALDIGRGDEVVTTPFTFFATAGAIHNVGATPVFADIEPDTFNISPGCRRCRAYAKDKGGHSGRPVRTDGADRERSWSAPAIFPSSKTLRSRSERAGRSMRNG